MEFIKEVVIGSSIDILKEFEKIILEEWIDFEHIRNDNNFRACEFSSFIPPKEAWISTPISCDFYKSSIFNRHIHCEEDCSSL